MAHQLSDVGHVLLMAAGLFALGLAAFGAAWSHGSGPAATFFLTYGAVATGLAAFLGLGTAVAVPTISRRE